MIFAEMCDECGAGRPRWLGGSHIGHQSVKHCNAMGDYWRSWLAALTVAGVLDDE